MGEVNFSDSVNNGVHLTQSASSKLIGMSIWNLKGLILSFAVKSGTMKL